ncbi:phage tail length tape measure family protein [Sphingobium sp. CR2-8]|uniref:phage tail length tape measure family protein n=1 Tax=Sphingobium sp. CR2-8 TaxID=1306534 RepID=UPI002DBCABFE|nr:phage tail length tape measure family protein [Sphingobium sp. CR2-8]MEC3912189.1 phage tail length tape measure family protein [Sphingobium sp. CR2-8]
MDVAALSMNIDSSKVVTAANDLDRFSASSDRAAASAGKVNFGSQAGSIAKMVALVQSIDTKMSALIGTLTKAQQAEKALAAANDNTASSMAKAGAAVAVADSHVIAYTQHLAGLAAAQRNANTNVLAYQSTLQSIRTPQVQADAHVLAYRDSLNRAADSAKVAATAIKFTAQDTLNASRQLSDIGVTLAMGMNPFMVAIQQGPQLLDILQNKAAVTGQTIGVVFRAAGAAIFAALLPLLPLIAALTLAAAGIAALTAQANDDSGLKKYTTAMGYTKAEVAKLNAVTVTFGDTTKAVFQVALRSAAEAMGINTADMAKTWETFLDRLASGTRATLAGIYAGLAGTRAYLAEIEKGGVLGLGKMIIGQGDPDIIKKTYGKAYADGQKALDEIVKQARANARTRQDTMAKAMYDAPKAKGGKSDAEKLADIIRNAEAEIKAEQAKADAVGVSAHAAAELEQRTKLLNQVEKAKIPITAAVRAELDRLAKSYADVKIAADTAAVIQGVIDGSEKQRSTLNDQNNLIGIYGDELTRARIQMEMLTKAQNALPKGVILSVKDANRLSNAASSEADDQILYDRNTRMEKIRKDAADAMYALDLESKGLGLTGAAAEAYAYKVERLSEAQRAGKPLSTEELALLDQKAEKYGEVRNAIDRMLEIENVKARGLDSLNNGIVDVITGVDSLGNAFKRVADQIIADLLRIAVQRSIIEPLANSLFPAGSSTGNLISGIGKALGFANGGAFGTPTQFANGGAFTNSVVTSPTLFRFANGAALGEMGEAGPEAIMPLKRGPNGSLGVEVHGGGKPSMRLGDNYFTIRVEGGFMPEAVMAVADQAGERAVQTARRSFQDWAAEWESGGSVV